MLEIGYYMYCFIGDTPIAIKERVDSFRKLCFKKYILFYFISMGVMGVLADVISQVNKIISTGL